MTLPPTANTSTNPIDAALPTNSLISGERSQATDEFSKVRDFLLENREDYEVARRGFQWPDFSHFNYALDWFDAIAVGNETTALWLVEEDGTELKVSYDLLRKRSNQAANWFRSVGVKRGDHVLLMLGNQVELWESILALMKIGAVMMPATTLAGPDEIHDRVTRGKANIVVARDADTGKFDALREERDLTLINTGGEITGWHNYQQAYSASQEFSADQATPASDPLFFYFTSGTTSFSKPVVHTHVSYTVGHFSTLYWTGIRPGDVHLNISSPGWGKHAWSNFFAPFHAEATVYLFNYHRFDADRLLSEMEKARVTSFCAPPTVWRMLIQSDLKTLQHPPTSVVGAGEPLNPEIINQVKSAWNVVIRDGYGQTETTLQIGNTPGQKIKPGSMGRPAPGYDIVLIDPESNEPSSSGEICIALDPRPLGLTTGYFEEQERTDKVIYDGYYHTGDLAEQDDEGYITFIGRRDDVFKASDYRISPFDLESALMEHELVQDVAVVPSPDPIRLAVPKAFIELVAGIEQNIETAKAIFEHSRKRLSPYKRIRKLEFYALPKTISGKTRRVELRQREEVLYRETQENSGKQSVAAASEWTEEALFPKK